MGSHKINRFINIPYFKLVHRRLAARNVLLTNELEPKIYGFCPQQQEAEGENKDDDGDAKEDKV